MLLERVLSKLTSFAAYSDAAKPNTTSSLEEDSDTSVFSDDEEYQEVRSFRWRQVYVLTCFMSFRNHCSFRMRRLL